MYKATANATAFGERTASKSLRGFAVGYNDIAPDFCVLAADCADQLATLRRNQKALTETIKGLTGHEKARVGRIIADHNRQIGDLAAMIERHARSRFEEIFVQVANRRLPRDAFMQITEEARSYWREEGTADLVPDGSARMKKKRFQREQMKRIDCEKRDWK